MAIVAPVLAMALRLIFDQLRRYALCVLFDYTADVERSVVPVRTASVRRPRSSRARSEPANFRANDRYSFAVPAVGKVIPHRMMLGGDIVPDCQCPSPSAPGTARSGWFRCAGRTVPSRRGFQGGSALDTGGEAPVDPKRRPPGHRVADHQQGERSCCNGSPAAVRSRRSHDRERRRHGWLKAIGPEPSGL